MRSLVWTPKQSLVLLAIHLESGGVTVKGVGLRGKEGGLLERGRAATGGGVVALASVLELVVVGSGGGGEAEEGVVEAAGISAEEARNE